MVWLSFCGNCEEQLDFSDSYCPSCKAKIAVEENNKTKKEFTGAFQIANNGPHTVMVIINQERKVKNPPY